MFERIAQRENIGDQHLPRRTPCTGSLRTDDLLSFFRHMHLQQTCTVRNLVPQREQCPRRPCGEQVPHQFVAGRHGNRPVAPVHAQAAQSTDSVGDLDIEGRWSIRKCPDAAAIVLLQHAVCEELHFWAAAAQHQQSDHNDWFCPDIATTLEHQQLGCIRPCLFGQSVNPRLRLQPLASRTSVHDACPLLSSRAGCSAHHTTNQTV